MDIWFLLMRDAFLMDSFDYPSQTALLGSTLSAGGEATHSRRAGGCDNVSPSEQVSCELERDLLDAGWSDPGSNTFGPLGDLSSRFEGDAALFGTVRGGISFGNFTKFAFYANAFAPNAGFDDGDWLGSGPGGEFSNPADLTMSFSPVLAPASVPEIPIPVMLLIGAAALSLAATLKNFGERPIAGSVSARACPSSAARK